jgi:hypothetical protein
MNANNRWIQVVLGFGFGVWLLIKGVNGLEAQSDDAGRLVGLWLTPRGNA